MTEKMTLAALHEVLRGLALPQILFFEETDSTNTQALNLANEQPGEFSLMIAERQSAGRGRMGRSWVTTPGTSLAFSLILKPDPEEIAKLGLFSLLGGLAVCRAIEVLCNIQAQVKWPNDVLLDGLKTAGVLAETSWQGERLNGLVLGIGINVLHGSAPPKEEVIFPATCVAAHSPIPVERLEFLAAVLEQVIILRAGILQPAFLQEYNQRLAYLGEAVALSSRMGEEVTGKVAGVAEDGCLLLEVPGGSLQRFPIGDLHLRPQSS